MKDQVIARTFGNGVSVVSVKKVFGGDINLAFRLQLSNGMSAFMKVNREIGIKLFKSEAAGLEAIRKTGTIRVPQVYGSGTDESRNAFLLMEWAEGRPEKRFYENFGRSLAGMHRAETSAFTAAGKFGFHADNYIGSTPQRNTPSESWVSFFRDHRLGALYELTKGLFSPSDCRKIDWLLDHLDNYLADPAFPSLLHGDLWSGNYITGTDGCAWLIDPAVYVGHHEADLAMTELFGGFSSSFYGAYHEIIPRDSGYSDRRDLYNLYHLLNHLHLFGASYYSSVMGIVHRYGKC